MGKELEFKLAAANDAVLDCLLGDPETAARMEGPIVCTPMETTYFDTETNAFRTNHWTLRRRQEGSRSVVCVKTPQPEPFARGEWEVEARAVDDAAIEWLLDFGAPRQLLQLYGEAPLRPVCGARFRLMAPVYTSSMIAELFLACGLTRARNFERELRISLRASATASSVRRRESST